MVKEQLAKLINVKSIVTIMLTILFCILSYKGTIPQEVTNIYMIVIAFYFGTQVGKVSAGGEK